VGNDADITEHKLAELALAERNTQLLLAGKDAGVGSYANNIKTGLIAVTEGYVAIHGLPERTTQTTLSQWRTKVHPDDLARFDELRQTEIPVTVPPGRAKQSHQHGIGTSRGDRSAATSTDPTTSRRTAKLAKRHSR